MAVDVRSQACSYLRAGAVTVLIAGPTSVTAPKPWWVKAVVAGDSGVYRVGLSIDDGWWCTCEAKDCAHVAAVQLCTGHDSLARKPGVSG